MSNSSVIIHNSELLHEHRLQRRKLALSHYYHAMRRKWPAALICEFGSLDLLKKSIDTLAVEITARGLVQLPFKRRPDDII